MPGDSMDGIPQIDEHDRGGGNYKDADGDGHITHDEAVGGDHNPVREAALAPHVVCFSVDPGAAQRFRLGVPWRAKGAGFDCWC
eukprot:COSAG02_NODE_1666_length_11424_cov_5.733245_9_plen_84_part_00